MKNIALTLALAVSLCASRAESQTFTTLVQFTGTGGTATGVFPLGNLTLSGTTLYGMTQEAGSDGAGNLFSVSTGGTNYKNVVIFTGTNGAYPLGSLTLSGSTLYGMTQLGGDNSAGNVFSVSTSGTNYRNLLSFTGTGGTATGETPSGNLTLSGTTLYGMTQAGGAGGYGNVFSVSTSGTNYQNVLSFTGSGGAAGGKDPYGSLALSGTTLYGMTQKGGPDGYGNVFSVRTGGTNYQNLASLTGFSGSASGWAPTGSLTLSGSVLYGMTQEGGADSVGNVFSISTSGSNYKNLVTFTGTGGTANGDYPTGSLTLSGTTLYGVTQYGGTSGGPSGGGSIFSVGIDGSSYHDLYNFTGGSDGGNPRGDLTLGGGTLFGMTSAGGASNYGTVFAFALPANRWAASGGGSWNTAGNWTSSAVPNGAGLQATLGSSLTVSSTVALDGGQTIGSLVISNSTAGYTLSAGSGGTLTLNNAGGGGSQIMVLAGTHAVTAPVEIANGDLTVTESSRGRLTISGNISDDNNAESLTLNGDGTGVMVLSGTNTYGGGTIVDGGKLIVTNPWALPTGGNLSVGAEAASILASPTSAAPAPIAVPEPSALALFGLLAVGLMRLRPTPRRQSSSDAI